LWLTYGDPAQDDPEGGHGPRPTSGWFEQRLTPEGVELMLSDLVARGPLLSPEQTGAFCPDDSYQLTARVSARDRSFFQGVLDPELVERITDPAAWLPPRAWADRQVRSFVPTRYLAFFAGIGAAPPPIPIIAAALPPPLDDTIRARDWVENHSGPAWLLYSTVTTEDARTMIDILDAAGVEQSDQPGGPGPEYQFEHPGSRRSFRLSFIPVLPGDTF
jgi:hypothetical protein